jgi:hypothetical protein
MINIDIDINIIINININIKDQAVPVVVPVPVPVLNIYVTPDKYNILIPIENLVYKNLKKLRKKLFVILIHRYIYIYINIYVIN